uniref:Peptidoglycan recognition protein n=1 Tax=Plutella xylostella TaxID=51655 RepID=A0AA51X3E1_PLUXY|nr:PGRP-LC [Plutella xylostella]
MAVTEDILHSKEIATSAKEKTDDVVVCEDLGDSDDSSGHNSRVLSTVSGALNRNTTTLYEQVAVTNSENVQFGNNTYFNGPVTIKQIVQNSGLENDSYVKTEDEKPKNTLGNDISKGRDVSKRKFSFQIWHILVLLFGCLLLIGVVCSILLSPSTSDLVDAYNQYPITDLYPGNSTGDPLIIAPFHLRVVPRSDWLAQPPTGVLDKISSPIPWVIISHTATEGCQSQSECVLRVRIIQDYHVESKKWFDIAYNFLVGGDGSAYVGRGWDYIGSHTKGYNKLSLGIAFIGTFTTEAPPQQQLDACKKLLRIGVETGKLAKDYKLLAHRQLMSTASPGDKLYDIIKDWPHFVKDSKEVEALFAN